MTISSSFPERRSSRLSEYDYSRTGSYFVTLCTGNRRCLFGEIVDGGVKLNMFGRIACECWEAIPSHFHNASLDLFIVMPNHIHGIINLEGNGRASHDLPLLKQNVRGSRPKSLTAIIGLFKSSVTRKINGSKSVSPLLAGIWQRNYYEHVIRDEADLNSIREYIEHNPAKWDEDKDNPAHIKT